MPGANKNICSHHQTFETKPKVGVLQTTLQDLAANLYYGNLYIDCYWFCQQCKDYFDTAEANGANCILFAALFFRGLIVQH